jgi:putative toxin-antitoxin system antitoxin component (TIGR02293 family)
MEALQEMLTNGELTANEVSNWLAIPQEDLTRSGALKVFSADQLARLDRLTRIIAAASKAIGDRDRALKWIRRENLALGGAIPARLIATEQDCSQVESVLGRIEYGGIS